MDQKYKGIFTGLDCSLFFVCYDSINKSVSKDEDFPIIDCHINWSLSLIERNEDVLWHGRKEGKLTSIGPSRDKTIHCIYNKGFLYLQDFHVLL